MLAIRAKICAVVPGPGYTAGVFRVIRFRGFCGQRNASHDYNTGDRIVVPDRPAPTRVLVRSAPRARRRCVRAMVGAPLARADERGENTGDTGGGRLNVLPDG
jgi:hypothetical protein